MQGRAGQVGRHEERETLDVVPVRVADEEMHGQRSAPILLGQGEAQLPDPGAGVEDEHVQPGSQLDARRVAPVQCRPGSRRRDRSPRAPEAHREPRRRPVGAQALDTANELVRVERLDEVVVGSHLPGPVDVRLVRLRRDHDHDRPRQVGIRPQLTEDLEAVHVVHDDVADDDRRPVRPCQGQPVRPLPGGEQGEAVSVEDEFQELEQSPVVVDDEQRIAGGGHRPAARFAHDGRAKPAKPVITSTNSSGSTGLPT